MFERKIKYLELWENGERQQTAGFVRLEAKEEEVSLQVKVEKLRLTDCGKVSVVLYGASEEGRLGEIQLDVGRGSEQWDGLAIENLAEGIAYKDLERIQIKLHGERELRCVIQERDLVKPQKVVESSSIVLKKPSMEVAEPSVDEAEPEVTIVEAVGVKVEQDEVEVMENGGPTKEKQLVVEQESEKEMRKNDIVEVKLLDIHGGLTEPSVKAAEYLPEQEELIVPIPLETEASKEQRHIKPLRTNVNQPLASTKWQQLWNIYPHVKPFEDNREYLRMKPEDFVILTKDSYPLCSNSFLLHGYYNYNHVILCRENKQGKEQYYIGVPGNFYAKEKQVAVLFGFESFEGKAEPAKNGDFGYYMIKVEI